MGFKYRRKAGDGGSCMGAGRRSSVISGVMVNKDRVRKSSGWTEGVVKVETDWAADLIARRDAVRFDLKDDLKLGNARADAVRLAGTVSYMVDSD